MAYMNIPFLMTGKKSIKNRYRSWFDFDGEYGYETGDIEAHFQGDKQNLPNGNARRWDYIIIKLKSNDLLRVVFAEPHPIKECNVKEVLEKLDWLKQTMAIDDNLKCFDLETSEFHWIYPSCKISAGSITRRKLNLMKLRLSNVPLKI